MGKQWISNFSLTCSPIAIILDTKLVPDRPCPITSKRVFGVLGQRIHLCNSLRDMHIPCSLTKTTSKCSPNRQITAKKQNFLRRLVILVELPRMHTPEIWCSNPNRYGFGAGARAIRYSVHWSVNNV